MLVGKPWSLQNFNTKGQAPESVPALTHNFKYQIWKAKNYTFFLFFHWDFFCWFFFFPRDFSNLPKWLPVLSSTITSGFFLVVISIPRWLLTHPACHTSFPSSGADILASTASLIMLQKHHLFPSLTLSWFHWKFNGKWNSVTQSDGEHQLENIYNCGGCH